MDVRDIHTSTSSCACALGFVGSGQQHVIRVQPPPYTPGLSLGFHISFDLAHDQNMLANIQYTNIPPTLFYFFLIHTHYANVGTESAIEEDDVRWRCWERSTLDWKWEWVIYIVLRLPQPLRPGPGHQSPTVSHSERSSTVINTPASGAARPAATA